MYGDSAACASAAEQLQAASASNVVFWSAAEPAAAMAAAVASRAFFAALREPSVTAAEVGGLPCGICGFCLACLPRTAPRRHRTVQEATGCADAAGAAASRQGS